MKNDIDSRLMYRNGSTNRSHDTTPTYALLSTRSR